MFQQWLERRVRHGSLYLHYPGRRPLRLGDGLPEAHWLLKAPRVLQRIAIDPEFQLGETYADGRWNAGEGGLDPLFEVLMRNFPRRVHHPLIRYLQLPVILLQTLNRVAASRRNVSRHYDLGNWLFERFLDADMHYSCAYFATPDMGLEEAQRAKCELVARKLLLRPGQRVLDIGCGWGGLALALAQDKGVRVTGLTLSEQQLHLARRRSAERGLADRVNFRLEDYRHHQGQYDRIVSVGMFEHVGPANYGRFFRRIRSLLKPDGVALLHTIGCTAPSAGTNPWIRRHIFPGGYIPTLSQITAPIEVSGLLPTDIEVLRLHYAHTLAAWRQRFTSHWTEVTERLGERFCRIWEFYLASCEAAFHWRGLVVFQVQMALEPGRVPITRHYLGFRPPSLGPSKLS